MMMNSMQAQLKNLSSTTTKRTSTKRKFYYWSFGRNYTHRIKTCSAKKAGHKEDAYYKQRLGGSEKGWEWWLGAIIDKIGINNPKFSLINCIGNQPNSNSKNTLEIKESGANIHLSKQSSTTMPPSIISNGMTARLPYGITVESSHIPTIQLPGLSKQDI